MMVQDWHGKSGPIGLGTWFGQAIQACWETVCPGSGLNEGGWEKYYCT